MPSYRVDITHSYVKIGAGWGAKSQCIGGPYISIKIDDPGFAHRSGHKPMPSLQFELSPPGRKAVPYKAKNRLTSEEGLLALL